jgi:hypothetical protein
MMSTPTIIRLVEAQNSFPGKTYPLMHYLEDLDGAVWSELRTNDTISTYRRNLQRLYVGRLVEIIKNSARLDKYSGDVSAIVMQRLEDVEEKLRKAMVKQKDAMTRYHLKYLHGKVVEALKTTG